MEVPRIKRAAPWAEDGSQPAEPEVDPGPRGILVPEAMMTEAPPGILPDEGLPEGFDPEDQPQEAAEDRLRAGGCLCGAVRYTLRGEPTVVGLCHCADCRKESGGVAVHFGDWPASAVRITGRLATHRGRSFCPACGSRIVHLSPDTAEIMLGTLDDPPSDLRPGIEIWTIRREPWLAPVPGAKQFDRDPP